MKYLPTAKKKVKIAENTFPITVETANLKNSLALSTKFVKGHEGRE